MAPFALSSRALGQLRRRPLRNLLGLAQIVVGALVMTLALCVYLGQRHRSSLEQGLFYVVGGYQDPVDGGHWFDRIRPEDMPAFLDLAPAVEGVAIMDFSLPSSRVAVVADRRYNIRTTKIVGPNYFSLLGLTPTRGSFFTEHEGERGAKVVVISEQAAAALYPDENPIGKDIGLMPPFMEPGQGPFSPTVYRVIGTFDGSYLHVEDSLGSPSLYIPYWAAGGFHPNGYRTTHLLVRAKPNQAHEAREQMLGALRQTYRNDYAGWDFFKDIVSRDGGFYVHEFESALGLEQRESLNNLLFALFGVVALIVGSIGVFSNTIVDVAERGHEIGLRRAIGADSGRIARYVMGETALLAAAGSLIGIALAALIIPVLSRQVGDQLFSGISLRFEPLAGLVVLVVLVLVSAGLGMIPALRAGRLKPFEALGDM